jgi:hypothetical protein
MQLVTILGDKLLRIVGPVKILSIRIFSGAGVIATHDKVRRAVVFADDGVPERLSRPRHSHCEREKSEVRHAVGIFGHDRLVDADTGVVVNVTGFGEANDGVDEKVRLVLP